MRTNLVQAAARKARQMSEVQESVLGQGEAEVSTIPDYSAEMGKRLIGQSHVIREIVPYVEMFEAGISPCYRPVGTFLLLGPTGVGKTKTVEALADALHGSSRKILRIDCGEFQLDHEVAKLIGAPPGYLGHRETQPLLSQQKLNATASERSSLSILLLDEVEKAAPSMTRLLLGVLDKASLKLGDGTTVNFERSLIFMTSNLGASEMMDQARGGFGLSSAIGDGFGTRSLESISSAAVRRRFSPEFINRIDVMLTYRPLKKDSINAILDLELQAIEQHIGLRLGASAFSIRVTDAAREAIIELGWSKEFGARELRRVIHRNIVQPLGRMVLEKRIDAGGVVYVEQDGGCTVLHAAARELSRRAAR